ncbi:MAG: DnaD domain protein [Mycoplasmatales bacterium]
MDNVVSVFNTDNYVLKANEIEELELEELGLIYYFVLIKEDVSLKKMLQKFNLDISEFKQKLQILENKKKIKLEIVIKEYDKVYWNISLIHSERIIPSIRNYHELFYLTTVQQTNLSQIKDSQELFLRLYNIYKNNTDKYVPQVKKIENLEQYTENLKVINPLEFIWSFGIKPDVKEVYTIYEAICLNNTKFELVNFLIDYTVSTSIYKNFSTNFFNKVLENWQNNDIKELDQAMKYVKTKKAEQRQGNYVDPNWEDIEKEETKTQNYNKLEEIEKIIKGTT